MATASVKKHASQKLREVKHYQNINRLLDSTDAPYSILMRALRMAYNQ
jgi:hypothetical protein